MVTGNTPEVAASRFDFILSLLHWTFVQVAVVGKKVTAWSSFREAWRCVTEAQAAANEDKKRTLASSGKPKKPRASPPVSGSKVKKQQSPPEVSEMYLEKDRPETATEKRIRALRKKLREIETLEEKVQSTGCPLEPAASEKVASKPELLEQLEALKQCAAEEAREMAVKAATEKKKAADEAKATAERVALAKAEADRIAAARARARKEALEVLPNISPSSVASGTDARLKKLLKQVAGLSEEVFHEDCLESGVSKKGGWRLTLLARPVPEDPENRPLEDDDVLLGFLVFRLRPDMQCLSIAKIAVPDEHRGRGFGKHLMEWCTKYAQQQGNLQYLSLSSLPEAVKFYQKYGFRLVKTETVAQNSDDLIEGQEYMEYRLKGGQKR